MQKRDQRPYNVAYCAAHRQQEPSASARANAKRSSSSAACGARHARTAAASSLRTWWISTTKVMLPRTSGFFSVPRGFARTAVVW